MIQFSCPSGDLKLFVETLGSLLVEAKIHVSPTGLSAIAVDSANVAMVLSKYDLAIDTAEELVIGIDLEKLRKLLNVVESLELKVTINEGTLTLISDDWENSIRLLDISTIRREPNPPSLTALDSKFTDEKKMIPAAIKKIVSVGAEKIIFEIKDSVVTMKNGDTGEDCNKRTFTSEELISPSGNATAMFAKDYLSSLETILKKLHTVVYEMHTDHPIKITAQNQPGSIVATYLVAPRIESAD